jgi:hypothetical protein
MLADVIDVRRSPGAEVLWLGYEGMAHGHQEYIEGSPRNTYTSTATRKVISKAPQRHGMSIDLEIGSSLCQVADDMHSMVPYK